MVSASLSESRQAAAPPRIWAIEGLRAWLAWTVVIAHVIQICGIDKTTSGLWLSQFLATEAVKVFVIISGFVIANVVMARRESWGRYITRRAFRIFPIYLLLLPVGAATMYLAEGALMFMSWAHLPEYRYDDMVRTTIASVEAQPAAHVVPHMLLLQGLIPDSLLDNSQTSFLGPAWSLSLEWQFYLIAPLLIWMLCRRGWSLAAIAGLAFLAVIYRIGVFGEFELPSFFPAIGYLFAIGIASRLVFERLKAANFHTTAVALACAAAAFLFQPIFALGIWGAFFALLVGAAKDRQEKAGRAVAAAAFESRPAIAMGARSYAVYLAHWPVIQAMAFFILPLGPFSQWQALAILAPAVIVTTMIVAEALHRFVEKPMIRLGATLASRPAPPRRAAMGESA
jgi:peptidoglycan/LPS O-acetylase OafA/YrhL